MPTFWALIEWAAVERPDHVVVSDDHGRHLTTVQLRDEAERAAAGLVGLGVRPGEVVSWQLPTVLEAPVLMAACARLGVVQNPLIGLLRGRELEFITNQIDTGLLVVPRTWRGFDHAEMAAVLGRDHLALDLEGSLVGGMRLPTGDPAVLPSPPADDAQCRWVYYSSGTTADPKGVRHTDSSVMAAANGVIDELGMHDGDVNPIAWPFPHIGGIGMLTAALRSGGSLVLFDLWDPETTPQRMAAHSPTILGSATPFFVAYVAAQRRHGAEPLFPDLRACTAGGAPTPAALCDEVAAVLGVRGVTVSWGLTEFPVATGQTAADDDLGRSVGRPARDVRVRVVDGELRLKGPQMFQGYVDRALDADGFDEDGWVRTGDLGYVDAKGRVHVTGRSKDVILRNAENISAQEIEEVLVHHPAISDAAVIGVPDARSGERVCAVIVADDAGEVTVSALVNYCVESGLARFKCPEQVELTDLIPRNSMGKVLKAVLRSKYGAP
jgi:acyl-CoA synthetase (AMP-forming)/AMP-acid ligase II